MIEKISREISINELKIHLFTSTDQLKMGLPVASKKNVFILDLEINGIKTAGLEISRVIRKHDELASIIFITIHDEFVYITYKYRVSALDFIAKNRGNIQEELKQDLIHIQKEVQATATKELFTYKSYYEEIHIPYKNICYFEANHSNTHSSIMYTIDNQQIRLNYNLRTIVKNETHFFRSHRSYLINPQQVKHVDFLHHQAVFYNGLICPVSRRHEVENNLLDKAVGSARTLVIVHT